jgi:hypothetical protein
VTYDELVNLCMRAVSMDTRKAAAEALYALGKYDGVKMALDMRRQEPLTTENQVQP